MNLELSIFVAQVDTEEVSTDNQNAELKKDFWKLENWEMPQTQAQENVNLKKNTE